MNQSIYPIRTRSIELENELTELENEAVARSSDTPGFLKDFSRVIRIAAQSNIAPGYLLREWIWIGSQLRMFSGREPRITKVASRFILFLINQFESLHYAEESMCADFRWVTEKTASTLLDQPAVEGLHTFITRDERRLAEDQWLELYEFGQIDVVDIESKVQRYLKTFEDVASECYLPELGSSIRMLLAVAKSDEEENCWAASALAYLVMEKDIVPDELGYFGLVDDIFVLNQAFAMCCRQAPWLAILNHFVTEWTDLSRLVISEGSNFSALPQYAQAILGSALYSLSHGAQNTCITVPQAGDVALTAAFFAALESAREKIVKPDVRQEIGIGSDILLTSANRTIKAKYQGPKVFSDQTLHMIELFKNCSVSIAPRFLETIHLAPSPHKKLSSNREFNAWRENFSPILLEEVLGEKLQLDTLTPQVLLITRRNKLEKWLKSFRPMGKSVAEMMGIRYYMRSGHWCDIGGTIATKPLLFVCSDIFTATELLRSTDNDTSCEFLRWIIADVSGINGDLTELALELKKNPSMHSVFLAGLESSEACKELKDSGASGLFVAPEDAGVFGPRSVNLKSANSLTVYMAQIRCQAIKKTTIIEVPDANIQALNEIVMSIGSSADDQDSSAYDILTYSLRQLLRRLARCYYPLSNEEIADIDRLISSSARFANMIIAYHPKITPLIATLESLTSFTRDRANKHAEICRLLKENDLGRTAIFCPSIPLKDRLASRAKDYFGLDAKSITTIDDLRMTIPYDSLIIPGWFDKKQMRELRSSGFANNYLLVLFPFEKTWEEVSANAQHRWRRQLLHATNEYAKRFEQTYKSFSATARWPTAEPAATDGAVEEKVIDWPDENIAQAISKARHRSGSPIESVKARLILFDDPEYFAVLRSDGRAICIPEVPIGVNTDSEPSGDPTKRAASAESLLSRRVSELRTGSILAFPVVQTGDLLDSLADEILGNSPNIRRKANLWRESLRDYSNRNNFDSVALQKSLEKAGVKRHIATIKHWLFTNETVAPRSWKKEIPRIGALTQNSDLVNKFKTVAHAIERIYQARREAADALLEQLRLGEVDLETRLLTATIEGTQIAYRVFRIQRIGPKTDVAADLVGKLHHFGDIEELLGGPIR